MRSWWPGFVGTVDEKSRAVFTNILHVPARAVVTARAVARPRTARDVVQELSAFSERPMIIRVTTPARPQQRYDHRLLDLVQRTGDVSIATDLGVPRSTARGWLGKAPKVVVSLDVTDLRVSELARRPGVPATREEAHRVPSAVPTENVARA